MGAPRWTDPRSLLSWVLADEVIQRHGLLISKSRLCHAMQCTPDMFLQLATGKSCLALRIHAL